MKIGITVDIRHSMFSAGHPNSCIAICETFQLDTHEVFFLRRESNKEWWDDVLSLHNSIAPCIHIDEAKVDLVIEVGFFLSPLQRKKFATCVWYCRKPALFTDMESTVYSCKPDGRDLEGISELWVAELFNGIDDLTYLDTLYPSLKIKLVPWLWTPSIVEAYRKEKETPVWLQVNREKPEKWSLHICETNMSNTSSCTIPLVTFRTLKKTKFSKVSIHNTEAIEKSQFFKENVLKHCTSEDISANLLGRQRIVDWCYEPGSVILAHSRFVQLRQANLEAAWLGIPIIHNNPLLRDLGCGLEELYYSENEVSKASIAVEQVFSCSPPYMSNIKVLTELRNRILSKFSPEANAKAWHSLLKKEEEKEIVEIPSKKIFSVLFTDMWSEFNVEYNTFTLALEAAGTEVRGYSLETLGSDVRQDIHIFGPFGESWKTIVGPKIHFTGENTDPIHDPSILLNIGFKNINDPGYLRMPLWMFEIDWFGADLARLQNPLVLPIETCTSCPYLDLKREKFCAFIVSNPKNPIRNEAFHKLNNYKAVDSAGRLFNTIGDKIFAGLGGGGGELRKHEFLKEYRFCLAYENDIGDGYVTEKLLHAKAAGCIPIYWGSSSAITDFNPEGFINASNKTPEEMVAMVKTVEEDPDLWKKIASIPLFYPETVNIVRTKFSKLVQHMLPSLNIAPLIGRSTSVVNRSPYFVSGVTLNFLPSLYKWLKSLEAHRPTYPEIEARIYVADDVPESNLSAFTKEFPFANVVRFPKEAPEGFPDFWEPQHYAWKLWILKEMANDPSLLGRLVFYMDSGSTLIRMPNEWIQETMKHKVSFLEDSGQKNERWCHENSCKILRISKEELEGKQLAACLLMFISGDPLVKRFFTECYRFGCIRDCCVGEKWVRKGNELSGHRHDQSIMSVLSQRYKLHRYPLEQIYCDVSARTTYYSGLFIYVHRGNYKTHIPFLPGIDDTFVVNLDRRSDRRKAFLEAHPDLRGKVKRHCAYNGLSLRLTPKLAGLFKPNDFFWKKAVMGCSLSHLKLWTMLLQEPDEIGSYLILEDDVRLLPGWKEAWARVYPNLPDSWECIYLGGVLPPNKEGFKTILESVEECPGLSRIAPNTLFGQSEPVRQFHFCTYSYILSRKGGKKLLESIQGRGGIWTSADHLLFNSLDKEHVYVLTPLVAGASQDDDPAYINSDFNDFSRKDAFDSDLWNNDERFLLEDVSKNLERVSTLDIIGALDEIPIGNQIKRRFLSLDICNITNSSIYEGHWLREFIPEFTLEQVSSDVSLDSIIDLVLVIQRPMWKEQIEWINKISNTGKKFTILHFSDEHCNDPIHFYNYPNVKGIIRFYPRPDLPENTIVLPLGYHWQNKGEVPLLSSRSYIWSFCGTGWLNRAQELQPLLCSEPNYSEFYPDWNYKHQKSETDYINLLKTTCFVPCPRGNNVETYRIYEALECGCIPVFTELPRVLEESNIPFLVADSWAEMVSVIDDLYSNKDALEKYHKELLESWKEYKERLRTRVTKLLV